MGMFAMCPVYHCCLVRLYCSRPLGGVLVPLDPELVHPLHSPRFKNRRTTSFPLFSQMQSRRKDDFSILWLTLKDGEDIALPVLWTPWFQRRMNLARFHPITPLSRPPRLLSTPSSFNTVIVSRVNGCCVPVMSARDYCCCTVLEKITCFDSQHAAPRQLASLSASVLSLKQISFVCVCAYEQEG